MGTDIPAAIRQFGARDQILYGHAQGVQGTVPRFNECFLDEADCDYYEVVRAFDEVGVDTFLAVAHLPRCGAPVSGARVRHRVYGRDHQGGQRRGGGGLQQG